MPKKYKKLIQRQGHGAATLTVKSDCVEVIFFGGHDKEDSLIADTTILRFGEYSSSQNKVATAEWKILLTVAQ